MLYVNVFNESVVMQLIGGYAGSLGLTKVPDVTRRVSAGQSSSVATDSAADVSESANTTSLAGDSLPPLVLHDLHAGSAHYTAATHDRRMSLETPTGITSATSIKLNFEGTHAKSHGRVHGTTVSNKTAASHGASRRKR